MNQVNEMNTIKVLDKGFVSLLNISGPVRRPDKQFDASSIDPAISARISFGNFNTDSNNGRTREQDLKLVKYLIENSHSSPIEMIEIWLEMKLPIFVARQFVRHRTATINEISGRYVRLPEEWYIPEVVGAKSADKKQGQDNSLDEAAQDWFKYVLNKQCYDSYLLYKMALSTNVAPEHARLLLHVNHYTHWVWKQDLHNMIHFLKLRLHKHAQVEAREYASAILELLRGAIPDIMEIAFPDE